MKKIKTIDNKIEQNKTQYEISGLSLKNLGTYKSLMGENVLPEKALLGKAATMKKFDYLPSDSELKKQTDIEKNNIND